MQDRRPEGFWNNELADDSKLDQVSLPTDENDVLDDDYMVIPLRFIRQNIVSDRQPSENEFFENDANFSPSVSTPRKWYGDKNELVNWLLRALTSSGGRKGALAMSPDTGSTNANEDSESTDVSAGNSGRYIVVHYI